MKAESSSILDMAMGAIKERVDYEMGHVIDNILDPNTNPTKKRKMVLTLELTPDSERRTIVVADRFPLLYFAREFGLDWFAAYPGCAAQSEPSARTVAAMIDYVNENSIPVILHMELANTMLSSAIAAETGARVLQFNSVHNVSRRDFERGVDYISLMEENLAVLEEALN